VRTREEKLQIPPLRCPGFPVDFVGAVELHAPFSTEGRIRGVVHAAWQEIRVRSGRDDKVGGSLVGVQFAMGMESFSLSIRSVQ
jgi:hypothetical protein